MNLEKVANLAKIRADYSNKNFSFQQESQAIKYRKNNKFSASALFAFPLYKSKI